MKDNFKTVQSLIQDIDFQKTQLMFNLEAMFELDDKNHDLKYDLNPFVNNIYYHKGEYTLDTIETIEDEPDVYIFNYNPYSSLQLLDTPDFSNPIKVIRSGDYLALKNDSNDWLILNSDEGEFKNC